LSKEDCHSPPHRVLPKKSNLRSVLAWVRGNNGTGLTDFVMPPFGGAAVMVGEDVVDKYVIERLERHIHNQYFVAAMRCFMNPTRSAANFFSFTTPWHHDSRALTIAKN
jgi:hypothetical protein